VLIVPEAVGKLGKNVSTLLIFYRAITVLPV